MHGSGFLSIWFFIGILLTCYGVLITGAGIYEYMYPPLHATTVLAELHTGIWWGAVLLVIGLIYFIKFYPKKS